MQNHRLFCRGVLLLLCALLLASAVFATEPTECDHDYSLAAYQAPRHRAEGFERYRCTKCGDEYEIVLDRIPEAPVVWNYDSIGNATSDTLTIFVGYYGMSYQQKIVLSIQEIMQNCEMQTQCFSYINRRPRVCYAVGYGPLLRDVLEYAGVDTGAIQAFQFGTADSGGNFYNQEEWNDSSLYRGRYFFPDLSVYYLADGSFFDSSAAENDMQWVEPMLAIWSSWRSYDIGEEFSLSDHSCVMSANNCFRLLYGQSWIGDASANTSAKWCNAIYIRYAGAPAIDAGNDLQLSVEKNKNGYQLAASIRAADAQLTRLFSDAVRWSSSDESVVRVDAKTGKLTVVGAGTATITATSRVGEVTTSDTLTVTVSDRAESTGSGGSGGGTGGGSGSGAGSGTGSGNGRSDTPGGNNAGDVTPGAAEGTPAAGDEPVIVPLIPDGAGGSCAEERTDSTAPQGNGQLHTEPGESAALPARGTLRKIQTPGSTGSGASGGGGAEVTLQMSSSFLLIFTALAALLLLLLGGLLKYLQYRKQMK